MFSTSHAHTLRAVSSAIVVVLMSSFVAASSASGEVAAGSRPSSRPVAAHRAGEVIVGFRAAASRSARERALVQAGARALAGPPRGVAAVAPGTEVASARRLARHPAVAWAEPNFIATALHHNDDEVPWNVKETGVNAEPVWSSAVGSSYTGRGSRVAVIDSGVDATHPELAGRVESAPAYDGADDCGHGTAVAGIVAAAHDGKQTAGVAPDATIVAVKALHFDESAGECIGDAATVAAAIRWAADPAGGAANVINLSLGLPQRSTAVRAAVAEAVGHGAIVVAAAGDTGDRTATYPAAEANVISVGGLRRVDVDGAPALAPDAMASFGKVDVAAPARDIPVLKASGVRAGSIGGECPEDDPHPLCSNGTSFAAPHVAGAAALLQEQHRTALAAEAVGSKRVWRMRQWLLGTAAAVDNTTDAKMKLRTGHGALAAFQASKRSSVSTGSLVTWAAPQRTLSASQALAGAPTTTTAKVHVSDGSGRPQTGVSLNFQATSGAAVGAATAQTGENGMASVNITGRAPGRMPWITVSRGAFTLPLQMLVLDSDDNIPGVAPGATSLSGGLNATSDLHDVYRWRVGDGEILRAHLSDVTDDEYLDMNVFGPAATDIIAGTALREDGDAEYEPTRLRRTIKVDGRHFVAVRGKGSYRLMWSIESPTRIGAVTATPSTISPDGDGRADRTTLSWRTRAPGRIVVTIRDKAGRTLHTLDLGHEDQGRTSAAWNGKSDRGFRVPDGVYQAVVRWEDGRGRFARRTETVRVVTG